jgi:tRNA-binding protein
MMITWDDFAKIEIRVGTIIDAQPFPEARNPSYILTVDFGSFGIKKSSAQITKLYTTDNLLQKQVVAVVNFPPKQIANFMSEFLVLGVISDDKEIILLQPEKKVSNGYRIG